MWKRFFKNAAIVFFCIAFALFAASVISIGAESEVGGWLLLFAGGTVVISAICAAISILMGDGGTGEKVGKLALLSSPFVVFIVIVISMIVLGVVGFLLWGYVFSATFI